MGNPEQASILETYDLRLPLSGNPLDIFKSQWTSKIPGYEHGVSLHFEDHRILWLEQQCGGFSGKRILELGPMDGAHTHMLATRGGEVLSIEASTRAYLRCLVMKEVLNYRARYLLGDFNLYLEHATRFDLVVASGVLYHMQDPYRLLSRICRVCDQVFLWTHYYDPVVAQTNPAISSRFAAESSQVTNGGRTYEYWPFYYNNALERADFAGGATRSVNWMTKDGLFDALRSLGFDWTVHQDHMDHPAGAAISLYACRVGEGSDPGPELGMS